METFIVQSKVKKYFKEKHGCNSSAAFFNPLNDDVAKSIQQAIQKARNAGRKTIMGKDFNFYMENPEIEESLVVASKIKRHIKETAQMATSAQAFEQLSCRIQKICDESAAKALADKRKTVMDRDFTPPTSF